MNYTSNASNSLCMPASALVDLIYIFLMSASLLLKKLTKYEEKWLSNLTFIYALISLQLA